MPSEINRNSFILTLMLLLFTACEVNHTSNVDGVEINGVVWAKANIDSPGTFASTPESAGLFYQWNKKIGWSTTNPLISTNGDVIWDKMPDTGDKWGRSKDPSPVGWRIPTVEDFESLLDDSRVKREWINQNGVKGYRFTDLMTGNSIFLLECGYRDGDGGLLTKNGFYYWTSTKYTESFARYFNGEMSPTYYRRAGFSIRCVAK